MKRQQQRILLVEDDQQQADLYDLMLRMAGFCVTAVFSAEEALAVLQHETFALVLSDWDLPGMSGKELIRTIREQHPGVKTVLMSLKSDVHEAAAEVRADKGFHKLRELPQLRQLIKDMTVKNNGKNHAA